MRVISGELGGRRINPPANLEIRPTTDISKEALFNILRNKIDFEEITVMDLFSGTGSISYEFVSRGAKKVVSVEMNPNCEKFIRKTIVDFRIYNMVVINKNVFVYLSYCKESFDLIFADPPYELDNIKLIPELIFKNDLLKPNGWLIVEHSSKNDFSNNPYFKELRQYGKVHFSFFNKTE